MNQPQWLTDALDTLKGREHETVERIAWKVAAEAAMRNANGLVVPNYNVHTDRMDWHFGTTQWPRLVDPKTDTYFTDDPFRERRDDIPLAEFMTYLRDWYYPQRRFLHWQAPEKAEV